MKFEDPVQFELTKTVNGREVAYTHMMEVSQGGPEIGTIVINGVPVTQHYFGGPFLHTGNFVYAPMYVKNFWKAGFKLARINTETLEIETYGKTKDIIFLDRKEGNVIHYFEDFEKTLPREYNPY